LIYFEDIMSKIKVLIVDDSPLIRSLFCQILGSDPEIEVVGTAVEPNEARKLIKELNPDVVTLDIEMPGMDGITFLEKIMSLRPMPVVMVSSLTQEGASQTIQCLELGAVDFVPKNSSSSFDEAFQDVLIQKVKIAARAKVKPLPKWGLFDDPTPKPAAVFANLPYDIIAIGSSTGGVEAVRSVIENFSGNMPPIVITQHMQETFTPIFASRLNGICALEVHEAANGMVLQPGNVYIAKGGKQMGVKKNSAGKLVLSVNDDPQVSGHRPSVDYMFNSIAKEVGARTLAIILTGMGKDGAVGMLELHKQGATTIGQDEATSVVYGMPKAAYMAGGVGVQLPLYKIPTTILKYCSGELQHKKSA
jgi:two-component system, chemotaxis family, protein-glutamate methylesterase/glutaminase